MATEPESNVPASVVIISYSRCLWCGRKTPHVTCHEHGDNFDPTDEEVEALDGWPNYDLEPEACDLPDGHPVEANQ